MTAMRPNLWPESYWLGISVLLHLLVLGIFFLSTINPVTPPSGIEARVVFESKGIDKKSNIPHSQPPRITKTIDKTPPEKTNGLDSTDQKTGQASSKAAQQKAPSTTGDPKRVQAGQSSSKEQEAQTQGSGTSFGANNADAAKIWRTKRDLLAYKETLGGLVASNWILPPVSRKNFKIVLEVIISPTGLIRSIKVLKSSGLAILDTAAQRAVRVSAPFPAFPKTFSRDKKEFKAVFRFTPDRGVH